MKIKGNLINNFWLKILEFKIIFILFKEWDPLKYVIQKWDLFKYAVQIN